MQPSRYRELLSRTLIAIAICAVAVVVCYFWVDRPVAFYVHRRHVDDFRIFRWLTYPPPIVQAWSPLIVAVLVVLRAWWPFARWQRLLLLACLSLIVADQFRTSAGDACGRYWPETWFHDNPSLIGSGTYGFHPFHYGDDIGSFPSGHAARILGFAAVWWIAVRKSRALCIAIAAPMLISLVAMNYHFVGDVIAGSFLGAIVGAWATALAPPAIDEGPAAPHSVG